MKAIIPAAGYATRLYPLTLNSPKCLIEVANKPMLQHIIEKIEEIKEIDHIYIITNDKFYDVLKAWKEKLHSKIPIKVLNDGTNSNENRLGAIGDINFVIEKEDIYDDVIIVGGDNLFDFSLKEAYQDFRKKGLDTITLYDVGTVEEARKMGVPTLDKHNIVLDFIEKPQNPSSTLISICAYIYKKETIDIIKEYLEEGNNPDTTGMFVEYLCKKTKVNAYSYKGHWFDIGTHEILEEARKFFSKI